MLHVGFKKFNKNCRHIHGEISKGVISDEKKPVTRLPHRKTKQSFQINL